MRLLDAVAAMLPQRWQPYAKTIAAGILALLTVLSTTLEAVPDWVTIALAILTAPVVFGVPNRDPQAEHQEESVQPPEGELPEVEDYSGRHALPEATGQPLALTSWSPKRPSRKGRLFIVGALLLTLAVELAGVFGDTDTISGLTADVFHTDTVTGRWIFTVVWVAFAAWFLRHMWTWGRSVKNPDRLNADQRR